MEVKQFCNVDRKRTSLFQCVTFYAFYVRNISSTSHVFIDFKKAFGRVWHAALCATMKKYNINANLIRVIKNCYDKAISTVLFNSSRRDWS